MKILKRNQLIVLVVSLMLITAGYLNFTTNQENVATSTIAERTDTAIGDAEFVSTVPHNENKVEESAIVENDENAISNEMSNEQENLVETNATEQKQEESKKSENDYYFITSKLDRNTMYSETLETYQEMYNNANATAEQKQEALKKINNINNTKNAIMIAENLIIAKGFKNVVIFANEGSISVVIQADELKPEEVAQIQNIVSRELNVSAETIHISNK
ncbi:putative uncharacterized protein [Clostridium sp. CAG:452]|jgi:stage III sporulation protein AH|nr:putative uncharacterized protein [Clostridium sp. CAG:452]